KASCALAISITNRDGSERKNVRACAGRSSASVTRLAAPASCTSTPRTDDGTSAKARPPIARLPTAVAPKKAKARRVTSMKIGKVPEPACYQVENLGE